MRFFKNNFIILLLMCGCASSKPNISYGKPAVYKIEVDNNIWIDILHVNSTHFKIKLEYNKCVAELVVARNEVNLESITAWARQQLRAWDNKVCD
ncbi:MAG: hypothetical protein RML94_01845 [Bacteroidia bacterium]|nr:hypothetical protein [Bacteroidia bacterium]